MEPGTSEQRIYRPGFHSVAIKAQKLGVEALLQRLKAEFATCFNRLGYASSETPLRRMPR